MNKYQPILTDYKNFEQKIKEKWQWQEKIDYPIEIPNDLTDYQKEVFLKEKLADNLKKNYKKTSYWIIQKWGGISSFKESDRNTKRLNDFREKLDTNKLSLTKEEFSIISSLSKIASFYQPDKYVIYDSRAIYSLNWLFFLYNIDTKYFPQPSGRNANMAEYDQKTIFNLSKKKIEYYDYKDAYTNYCKLIKDIALLDTNINNFDIEMFLFSIASDTIITSIKETLSLNVVTQSKLHD